MASNPGLFKVLDCNKIYPFGIYDIVFNYEYPIGVLLWIVVIPTESINLPIRDSAENAFVGVSKFLHFIVNKIWCGFVMS